MQALQRLEERMPGAAALNLQLQHLLGSQLDSLSMAQLDALEELHYMQLEHICKCKLQLHRQRQREGISEALKLDLDIQAALNGSTESSHAAS